MAARSACWHALRFVAAILLLLSVTASGTGGLAHLHRAHHAAAEHAGVHAGDAHCHHDCDDVGDSAVELTAADAEHDDHCQICVELLFRVAVAEAAPPTVTSRAVATADGVLVSQVLVVAAPVHIESTGPPTC